MSFWTDKNLLEPLRQNRWLIKFTKFGFSENIYALKEAKKPSFDIPIKEHKLINHYFRYPGVLKWNPIDIKMVASRVIPSVTDAIKFYLEDSGYASPINNQFTNDGENSTYSGLSKDKMILEGSGLELIQVDANGKEIEIWNLYNPIISKVDFGNLSYGSDDFVEVSFTINYDWAEVSTRTASEQNSVSPG